jgi:methylenetetrahydrofolate reductase (NADPH)
MRIREILAGKRSLSFEVFPPKPDDDSDMKGIFSTIARLASARPDFVSVTYSPAGRNRTRALEIADFIQRSGLNPLSHFTSVGYLRSDVDSMLSDLAKHGVENVMALRGDLPADAPQGAEPYRDFRYASDLMAYISSKSSISIGGAAYPHGHQEGGGVDKGIEAMKAKEAAGTDFFITQLFFDNDAFDSFLDKARGAGLTKPVIPGIMPVLRARQMARLTGISGCVVPPRLAAILERWGGDNAEMERAGIEFAARQIADLWASGVPGIHVYTMNKPASSIEILKKAGILA